MKTEKMNKLNLEEIYLFKIIVDEGSFRKASKTLGITQVAITKKVQKLSTKFNDPLIIRNNGTHLTEKGNDVYNMSCELHNLAKKYNIL